MPRRKISEYRSKKIIHEALNLSYTGWGIESKSIKKDLKAVKGSASYVVKVDQSVKGRFKKGLVALDVSKGGLESAILKYTRQGYSHFIVEPYVNHKNVQERYLSLVFERTGVVMNVSEMGGVDIEGNADSILVYKINDKTDWLEIADKTGLSTDYLASLMRAFHDNHFVFLEINPYTISSNGLNILDAAVEVDDASSHLVDNWSESDVRHAKNLTKEESIVRELDEGSVASFNLSVIHPQGSIFLLLSGGGASIVVADEIYNRGYGKQLANYGEYSGNPSHHETFKYTSQVLELLLASKSPKKILFIGGAVANFTDIAVTFAGIIEAIDVYALRLKKHNVKVFVRRGGPNQEEGLENIRQALKKHNILGAVYDASTPITEVVGESLKGIKK